MSEHHDPAEAVGIVTDDFSTLSVAAVQHGSPCARRGVRPEPLRRRRRILSAALLVGPTPMFHDLPVLADFTPAFPPPEAVVPLPADGR